MPRPLPFLSLLLTVVLPASGWWETGHEVIARIAASQLTPAAQTRIARILGVPDNKEDVANALAIASIWADQTKGETKSGEWHYIDLTMQDRRDDEVKRCPAQDCLPAQIIHFEELLKEGGTRTDPRWTETDALRFLVHFVGDAAQPLHTIDDADAGGNCEQVVPAFEKAKNLHALWDGGIIAAMGKSDRELAAQLEADIERMSRRERRRLAKGEVMDWIWEAHELALKDIYHRLNVPVAADVVPKSCADAPPEIRNFTLQADPEYVRAMEPVVESQLIRGGLRLARVLNETL